MRQENFEMLDIFIYFYVARSRVLTHFQLQLTFYFMTSFLLIEQIS